MLAARLSIFGAIAAIGFALCFALVPGIDACGPPQGASKWGDFQHVESVGQVTALVRPDCAERLLPALRYSMWLDALAFIPAFTLFLGALAVALRPSRTVLAATLVLLGTGVVADQLEGRHLLSILDGFPGTQAAVGAVMLAGMVKHVFLGLASAAIGLTVWRVMTGWTRWSGVVAALAAAACALMALTGADAPELALGISWLSLLLVSLANLRAAGSVQPARSVPASF